MIPENKLRLCEKENEWAVAIIKKLQAERDMLYQLAYTPYNTSYKEEWKDEQRQVIALEKLNEKYRGLKSAAKRLVELVCADKDGQSRSDDAERTIGIADAIIREVEDCELLYDLLTRR